MKKIASMLALLMVMTTFSACASKTEAPEENNSEVETGTEDNSEKTYDNTYEADVVIVGAGGGGLATAL